MTAADTSYVRTVRATSMLYAADEPDPHDPAEAFHEASKLYPSFVARQTRGQMLEGHLGLQVSSVRAAKRSSHRPAVALPASRAVRMPLGDVIAGRRSRREFATDPIALDQLSALLDAAYGTTGELDLGDGRSGPPLRSAPSAGALFPLDLYLLPWRVGDLAPALYHFDPLRRVLEHLRDGELRDEAAATTVYADVVLGAAVVIVVAAMFWRTRFKYGLRGYRFALIECGHVAQNVLLTAHALGLAAVPLGGFFDRRLDRLLRIDGVDESALYTIAIGRPA